MFIPQAIYESPLHFNGSQKRAAEKAARYKLILISVFRFFFNGQDFNLYVADSALFV